MLSRFFLYGVAGWTLEVVFTGVCSALGKDRAATSKTYLWMHPIYGSAALAMEELELGMKRAGVPLPARAAAHTGIIYGVEYGTGWLLRRGLGACPWDYGACGGRSVQGLVRLDYAPLWYGVAVLFTLARPWLREVAERRPRSRWQRMKDALLPSREEPQPLSPHVLSATRAGLGVLRAALR